MKIMHDCMTCITEYMSFKKFLYIMYQNVFNNIKLYTIVLLKQYKTKV